MKRKWLAVGIILLFVGVTIVPAIAQNTEKSQSTSRDNWWYVGGSGPGNYTKIQDAVNNASNGDTVFVYHELSPYNETLRINKSINVIGENKNTTIIDGYLGQGNSIIGILSDGVVITGFTIQKGGELYGGIAIFSNNNRIENNYILNTIKSGIYVHDGHHHNLIRKNIIIGSNNGVLLRYESFENDIVENCISHCDHGILVNGVDYNVSGNILRENTYGIYVASLSEKINSITNNYLDSNKERGICIESSTSFCFVSGNTVNNSFIGITLENGMNNTITLNTVKNCSYGIYNSNSRDNLISKNNFTHNDYGVESPGLHNSIVQNNFLFNRRHAKFHGFPTVWDENYWNNPRDNPKIIVGSTRLFLRIPFLRIPWMEFDWHPALKPYDIPGVK
jgi:parallel beta-helix repeat protein